MEDLTGPDPTSLRRALLDARERARVRGEQAWQLAALPFSLAMIVPVFAPAPWRLRSFALGAALALVLWGAFKILAAWAARRARALEGRLASRDGGQAEGVTPDVT